MLIEARPPEWAVIGIGVNVAIEPDEFPDDLRWPATSVGHGATVGRRARRGLRRARPLGRGGRGRGAGGVPPPRRARGREVSWEGAGIEPGTGIAAGIDERGNLVVELAGGERLALGSGEVSLRLN